MLRIVYSLSFFFSFKLNATNLMSHLLRVSKMMNDSAKTFSAGTDVSECFATGPSNKCQRENIRVYLVTCVKFEETYVNHGTEGSKDNDSACFFFAFSTLHQRAQFNTLTRDLSVLFPLFLRAFLISRSTYGGSLKRPGSLVGHNYQILRIELACMRSVSTYNSKEGANACS